MSDQTKSDDAGNASSPEVVKALEDKIAKLESQVQGTEKLLQKWGNEQGSSRKAIESTVNELKKIMDEKNPKDLVDKLKEIEEKDKIRNFQPPISGQEIMETFNLPACATVGNMKMAIKDAILDGIIPNEYEAARAYMHQIRKDFGV